MVCWTVAGLAGRLMVGQPGGTRAEDRKYKFPTNSGRTIRNVNVINFTRDNGIVYARVRDRTCVCTGNVRRVVVYERRVWMMDRAAFAVELRTRRSH